MTPKSPLDKPSSSSSRRPSSSRRSSTEKSSKSTKHGVKSMESHSSGRAKDSTPESSSSAIATHELYDRDYETRKTSDTGSMENLRSLPSGAHEHPIRDAESEGEGEAQLNSRAQTSHTASEEVERLRAAMNAQLTLSQHRENLAKRLEGKGERESTRPILPGGKTRVSPIHEETSASPSLEAAFASPLVGPETASTESAKTVRGGVTPGGMITPGMMSVRTPSYPFPPMRTPQQSYTSHRPFTALSPTVNPSNYAGGTFKGGPQDHLVSGSVTPASSMRFQPSGTSTGQDDPNFETPNLYEISLMLSAEPGLEPWWTTVVEIMRTIYKAHRVTLSVPGDATDIENVPWGQKASFNCVRDDELSLTYLPRGSSLVPSSVDTNETSNSGNSNVGDEYADISTPSNPPLRPGLLSRSSFTAYEDTKRASLEATKPGIASRPVGLTRAQSYLSTRPSGAPPRTTTLQNAELSLQSLESHLLFEEAKEAAWENPKSASQENKGQVFTKLQALEYEAEPLIDNKGVSRVLSRGKVIALTRDYPYVETTLDEKSCGSKSSTKSTKSTKQESPEDKSKKKPAEASVRLSFLSGARPRRARSQASEIGKGLSSPKRSFFDPEDTDAASTARYEEYEQAPPSPWSQSPAPSPALRVETSENPFFADAPVDEESFNPQSAPQDYLGMPQPETIGADRSWTVLHIPLIHPLLSKPVQAFRLNSAAMESRTARGKGVSSKPSEDAQQKAQEEKRLMPTPIAILSILSPLVPYPSGLRHSLQHLSSHLATSFSLCRHYTHLEIENAGLAESRKRPHTIGFGAVIPGERPRGDALHLGTASYSPADEGGPQQQTGGSITSPSDYSGVSRSTAGSPVITPGWEMSSAGLHSDNQRSGGDSPGNTPRESYFQYIGKNRPDIGRVDTGSAASITAARRTSKESSPAETRLRRMSFTSESTGHDRDAISGEHGEKLAKDKHGTEDLSTTSTAKQESRSRHRTQEAQSANVELRDPSPSRRPEEAILSPRRVAMRTASEQGVKNPTRSHSHTQLHSYGADFGATFQSLPTAAATSKVSFAQKSHARSASLSAPAPDYMPPPSDRVKGLMLDSLPMHIFIALPPTGEIVWVNSRYLTYRGQDVADLHNDPWVSIHPEYREEYLKKWTDSIHTGEPFFMEVKLRRFDGTYRWFATRAVGLQNHKGVIVQWYGTHIDINDQHEAEQKAIRQAELEASEAKHRQLANLIPQIIFSAKEDVGVTFVNQQWVSYTGQDSSDALGLGFMDHVHPEDLARCHIAFTSPPTPSAPGPKKPPEPSRNPSQSSSGGKSSNQSGPSETVTETTIKGRHQSLSRTNSSSNDSMYEYPTAALSELARSGVVKVDQDNEGRDSYSTEVRIKSKSGDYRWHLVRCVEVDNINPGSGDGSWFGACTDINDHKLLEMKLKEAMDSKSKFLSNMSHEIRTPLIGISGMIGFLQDSRLNEEQIDCCNTIASSADGLMNIINDILDLAKADAGMMKLNYDWFHTRSLVEEVNETVSTIAFSKRLDINYIVEPDVPEMIKGDRFRIRQVLLNVIGNAIKFTTKGEVSSTCKMVRPDNLDLGENEVMLEFSIVDTGRGFTQEEAEMIFKPFSQIDGSSTRTHGGTGLGLVISRQFVELHGGKMEGSAIPGKGSTFTFTARFGLATPDDHPEPPLTPALSKYPSARSSIRSSISELRPLKQVASSPLATKTVASPSEESPRPETINTESPTVLSSGSSEPSLLSSRSQATKSSSSSGVEPSLVRFGEAARLSSPDPSNMKLALPDKSSPPLDSATATALESGLSRVKQSGIFTNTRSFRPLMFSILLICPLIHSRAAIKHHMEMTLPDDIPSQITSLASVEEAKALITGEEPVLFTHIVLNLDSADEIVALIDQIIASISLPETSIVVLSDPILKQEVIKSATVYDYDQLAQDNRVRFIYKPVKPSRFAVIFDPDRERDLSTDRNRFTAQQAVEEQRQSYVEILKQIGNKGHRFLLVEDNPVNQKVLMRFLEKMVGKENVDLVMDGVECTERIFSNPWSYYSLILCDLQMPNKDGYQTCKEIRQWEKKNKYPKKPLIALSANVMGEVEQHCIKIGFSAYITKPVKFPELAKKIVERLEAAAHSGH